MLENDGEDQLEQSCEKLRSITWSQVGEKYCKHNKKEATLAGFVTTYVECVPSDTSLKERIDGKTRKKR